MKIFGYTIGGILAVAVIAIVGVKAYDAIRAKMAASAAK